MEDYFLLLMCHPIEIVNYFDCINLKHKCKCYSLCHEIFEYACILLCDILHITARYKKEMYGIYSCF